MGRLVRLSCGLINHGREVVGPINGFHIEFSNRTRRELKFFELQPLAFLVGFHAAQRRSH